MRPLRVGLIGYVLVQALDLVGPSDAFTIAAQESENGTVQPAYEVLIIGLTNKSFRAESGVIFQPHVALRDCPALDTLIIPGGKAVRLGAAAKPIAEWILSKGVKRLRRIASACTGIYALAPTGLLDDRKVTTHWRFADDVARRFPKLRVDPNVHISKTECFTRLAESPPVSTWRSHLSKRITDRASRFPSRASWWSF